MVIICQGTQTGYKAIRGAAGTRHPVQIFSTYVEFNLCRLCKQHQIALSDGPAPDQQPPNLYLTELTSSFAALERDRRGLSLLPHNSWCIFKVFHVASLSPFYLFCDSIYPIHILSSLFVFICCFPGHSVGKNDIIREISDISADLNSKYTEYWIAWHSTQRPLTVTGHSRFLREELDRALFNKDHEN